MTRYSLKSNAKWNVYVLNDDIANFENASLIVQYLEIPKTILSKSFSPLKTFPACVAIFLQSEFPEAHKENNIIALTSFGDFPIQVIYQASHEICHLCIPRNVAQKFRFLEETLCEIASCFVLNATFQDVDNSCTIGKNAFSSIPDYIANLERVEMFCSLHIFIRDNLQLLQQDEYVRPLNSAIAFALLPLFEADSSLWCFAAKLSELDCSLDFFAAITKLCAKLKAFCPNIEKIRAIICD